MIQVLDEILLSDDVVKNFFEHYSNTDFREWLLNVLPEVADCEKQQQDNPWHIFDCLNHILTSVSNINAQTKDLPDNIRRMLSYVMFYHDIGKPACHIRRFGKIYGREVDSFFGHNLKSEEIAKRTLSYFGFNNNEIKIMLKLINKHDIFMFIRMNDDGNEHHRVLSNDLLMEEIEDLNSVGEGKTLLRYLIKIGRSDNRAQNPQMTKPSLKMLDCMDQMLDKI
jgi:hypothetical protein